MIIVYLNELYKEPKKYLDKEITIKGWIRSQRKQKDFGFIDFSDGTCFKHIQVVYDNKLDNFSEVDAFHFGSSIEVIGTLVKSEGKT